MASAVRVRRRDYPYVCCRALRTVSLNGSEPHPPPTPSTGHAAQASQWAFFVDASCPAQSGDHTHPPPWLLAVRLEGAVQGMDWLDPGTHAGAVLELRDVVVGAVDADSRVQQVVADKHSSISPR